MRASLVLSYSITVWFGNSTAQGRKALQRVVKTAHKIAGTALRALEDLKEARALSRAHNITKDATHPQHELLELLPSGRRYRSIAARTTRLKDSFFPKPSDF